MKLSRRRGPCAAVEGPFEGGEVLEQLGAQSVDRPGAIAVRAGASRGQDPKIDGDVVAGPQRLQVPGHTGLVGDVRRILSVLPAPR